MINETAQKDEVTSQPDATYFEHEHVFLGANQDQKERKSWPVIALAVHQVGQKT